MVLDDALSAPGWFDRAVAQRARHRDLQVAGRRIHYRMWGDAALPALLLVHGAGANSSWWDHIAPQLSGFHCVAPDLGGHGDSDHRDSYDIPEWTSEVLAVAAAERLYRPVVIGHSLGGRVAVAAGGAHPESISGVAFIDSPLNRQPPGEESPHRRERPHRVYADAQQAVARFRTLPPQETVLPYVQRHVARQSLRPVEGGWTWKFDPFVFRRRPSLQRELAALRRPAVLLRCEQGLVDVAMAAEMQRLAAGPLTVVELPAAGHHPMLDQPLVLVAALNALLAARPPQ
jgi:pimeloyl-ACP methyl ester carboxylesterase